MLFSTLTAFMASSASSRINDLISRLDSAECYTGRARVSLSLPQRSDDVIYDVSLMQVASPADTLAPASYITEMTLYTPLGPSRSFAAYFDGNFYRSRGPRLQEYHYPVSPEVFIPEKGRGIQFASQFVELMPRYLAHKLREDMNGKDVYMKLETSASGNVLTVLTQYDGNVAREERYVFDPVSYLPVKISIEANPATISEQTIDISYVEASTDRCRNVTEELLMERYPDIFTFGRESDYRLESLVGGEIPAYALRDLSGVRRVRRSGDKYPSPVIMAFIEPENAASEALVADIRREVSMLPETVTVMWAYNGNVDEEAREMLGELRDGECVLMSVRGFARDCGVAGYPSVVVCGRDGKVAFVRTGYNKELPAVVMQQMALLD